MQSPTVIIWEGQWWQENINKALIEHGFKTVVINTGIYPKHARKRPRDCFVDYNGIYLDNRSETTHPFWEWWAVLVGKDFALLSEESIYCEYDDLKVLQDDFYDISLSRDLTPYVIPNLYNQRKMLYENIDTTHIDRFMLLCPQKELFLLDINHIRSCYDAGKKTIEQVTIIKNIITRKIGLTYIEYDWRDEWIFPLNCLVLPWMTSKDTDTVVVDAISKRLIALLESNQIDVIPVDMPQFSFNDTYGKICCQTNTVANSVDQGKIDYLLHK